MNSKKQINFGTTWVFSESFDVRAAIVKVFCGADDWLGSLLQEKGAPCCALADGGISESKQLAQL